MAETDHRRKLKRLEEQERKLAVTDFTLRDAWRLGSIIVEIADERELPIAIRITLGEQVAFHAGMPGSSAENDAWIARKERTVRLLGTSSFLARIRGEVSGRDYAELDRTMYALAGGCVPLRTPGGTVLGTVAVSGLPQADDHALVVDALTRFLTEPAVAEPTE